MPIIKKREIENLEQLSGEELQAFLDQLPERQQTISSMLYFVEDELFESQCNHSLQHAMRFTMDTLLSADAPIYQYLDRESVQALINDHLSGRTNRRLLIWSLLNFKEWLDRFL